MCTERDRVIERDKNTKRKGLKIREIKKVGVIDTRNNRDTSLHSAHGL